MKCLKCGRNAEISYPNGDLCKDCFLEVLVSRIKKEIRLKNPFSKNEKVLVHGKLAEYFLKKAVGDLPLKIKVVKPAFGGKVVVGFDKIVIPITADDEAEAFFEEMMKKKASIEKKNSKIVKIFVPVLDSELVSASKILKIHFKAERRSREYEKIRQRNPASAFGLVKSKDDVENN
ncbi:hypothetical protein JXB27_00625 [Candidatus Woesearchaeota archaeon]|nr:hypothetical protein [Candidatus Woesearchaeota archaeon]